MSRPGAIGDQGFSSPLGKGQMESMVKFCYAGNGLRFKVGANFLREATVTLPRESRLFDEQLPAKTIISVDEKGYAAVFMFRKDMVYKGVPFAKEQNVNIFRNGMPMSGDLANDGRHKYYVINNIRFMPGSFITFHPNGKVSVGKLAQDLRSPAHKDEIFKAGERVAFNAKGDPTDKIPEGMVLSEDLE
jgi:hypothetical protein